MSVETQINRIKANIASAYAKAAEKGAALPEVLSSGNLPETIETIPKGSDFSVPLAVYADAGAAVTARLGDIMVAGTSNDTGIAVLLLPAPGDWSVSAELEETKLPPKTVSISGDYSAYFDFNAPLLPEGYTELEYIQNSNGSNSGYLIIPWSVEVKHFVLEFENLSVPGTSGKNIQTLTGYDLVYKSGTTYINSHSGIFLKTSTIEAITKNSVKSSVIVQNFQKRNIFEFDCINNVLKINKVEHPFDCSYLVESSSSTTRAFFYERASTSGSNTSTYGRMLGKMFQIKTMDSNGDILYKGIPCSKDDGTFGLYDIVSGTFMSLDALKFIPGPAV